MGDCASTGVWEAFEIYAMNCDELLAALNEYVDGSLSPGVCQQFEEHLKGCNPCQVVVDNIRQTIRLFKAGEPFEMPPEFHKQLHDLLRAKWRAKFASAEPEAR